MLRSGISLLAKSGRVFLEAAPEGIDPDAIGRDLAAQPGVVEVHDLHVWEVTSGFPALSAHVVVKPDADCHGVRRELARRVQDQFGIEHTTLQVDHETRRGLIDIEPRAGDCVSPDRVAHPVAAGAAHLGVEGLRARGCRPRSATPSPRSRARG